MSTDRAAPAAGLLLALLAAAAAAEEPPAPSPGTPAPPAEAAPADPVGEARRLHAEGKEFFRTAGDTDLSRDERRKARQEAFRRLDRARKLLDAWLAAHPADAEALDDLYTDIATTLYWVRKEAGVGELEPGGPKPAPAAPAPAAPAPPKPPTPREALDRVKEYEKAHPGDVPGLHERYTKFLEEHPDRGTPEFEEALARVDDLGRRLKDAYRRVRDEDPDALAGADPAEIARLVDQLAPDLASPDASVRRRAARYLGGLGSGKAAPALVDALFAEGDAEVLEAIKVAVARIGGSRTCARLAREKAEGPRAALVLDVLLRMVKGGGVSARLAGEAAVPFARPLEEGARGDVAEVLREAGREGALGLSLLVDGVAVDRKVGYIEHLGKAGDPRAAAGLARFLTVNPQGARRRQQQAAVEAIRALGKPAIRWLIPSLDDPAVQVWTAELLRELSGARPKDDKRKTWEKWLRENRRAVEGR